MLNELFYLRAFSLHNRCLTQLYLYALSLPHSRPVPFLKNTANCVGHDMSCHIFCSAGSGFTFLAKAPFLLTMLNDKHLEDKHLDEINDFQHANHNVLITSDKGYII